MEKYCTLELDKKLQKIDGIKYLPWIGKNSLGKKEKTLIVGESVYNWETDSKKRKTAQEKLELNNFARIVIYEQGIENPHPKRIFARNIEKTLNYRFESDEERIEFWKGILFHELVQRPLESKNSRPKKDDYQNGAEVLAAIIKLTKPSKCIFLGTTWSKFICLKNSLDKIYKTEDKHFGKINGAYPKTLFIPELKTKIYFVKHPSKFFTTEKWKYFINNN